MSRSESVQPSGGDVFAAYWRSGQLFDLFLEHGDRLGDWLRAAGIGTVIARDEDSILGTDERDAKAAVLLAAGLSAFDGLGVIASVDLSLGEPFNISREIAALDILSDGRAGLAVRVPRHIVAPATAGIPYQDLSDLGALVREGIEVARLLWDSWDADAVVRDWDANRFVHPDRVHTIDYRGRVLNIRGPAATPRSPQGIVPVLADLLDETDWPEWVDTVDAVLMTAPTAVEHGPDRLGPRVLVGVDPREERPIIPPGAFGVVQDYSRLSPGDAEAALRTRAAAGVREQPLDARTLRERWGVAS